MEIHENKTPRMRTLPMAMKEIKAADPGTQLTLATLRKLVDRGLIGTVPLGNYRLVDLDKLLALLSDGARRMYREKFTARAMTEQLEALYEKAAAR